MSNRMVGEVRHSGNQGGAIIVGDYRFLLWRVWDDALPRLLWVMHNPSTADGEKDDATIRRCFSFSRRWGYGGLDVVNLFALRAADPRDLLIAPDPIGPANDGAIAEAASCAAGIVVAWGERGGNLGRDRAVLDLLQQPMSQALHCLGTARNGQPRHPLRLAGDTPLVIYSTDQL